MEQNLKRINELARLAKQRQLTEAELKERDALRKAYLEDFRKSFKAQLDSTVVQYPDGSRVPFKDVRKP